MNEFNELDSIPLFTFVWSLPNADQKFSNKNQTLILYRIKGSGHPRNSESRRRCGFASERRQQHQSTATGPGTAQCECEL